MLPAKWRKLTLPSSPDTCSKTQHGWSEILSFPGVIKGEMWFETHAALCDVISVVCVTSCLCSLWSIAAISVNRFIHICKSEVSHSCFLSSFRLKSNLRISFGTYKAKGHSEVEIGNSQKRIFSLFGHGTNVSCLRLVLPDGLYHKKQYPDLYWTLATLDSDRLSLALRNWRSRVCFLFSVCRLLCSCDFFCSVRFWKNTANAILKAKQNFSKRSEFLRTHNDLLLCFPFLFSFEFRYDRKSLGCLWDRINPNPYFLIVFALTVGILTSLIALCYLLIFLHVKKSKDKVCLGQFASIEEFLLFWNSNFTFQTCFHFIQPCVHSIPPLFAVTARDCPKRDFTFL